MRDHRSGGWKATLMVAGVIGHLAEAAWHHPVLELSWDLICPSCRTSSERGPSLSKIGESGHCNLCDITYELDFDRAVNVTLGLPIVRTSVDHGTAYDLAGKGVASAGSMIAAMLLAANMVRERRRAEDPVRRSSDPRA